MSEDFFAKRLKGSMKPLIRSEKKVSKIDRALTSAEANMAVEGFMIQKEEKHLVRARLQGELSDKDFRIQVMKWIYE
jgi:hypothetical protein